MIVGYRANLLWGALCPYFCAPDPILPSKCSARSSAGGLTSSSQFASRDSRTVFLVPSKIMSKPESPASTAFVSRKKSARCAFSRRRHRWSLVLICHNFRRVIPVIATRFVLSIHSDCQITHLAGVLTRAFGFLCNLIYYCTQGDPHAVTRRNFLRFYSVLLDMWSTCFAGPQ